MSFKALPIVLSDLKKQILNQERHSSNDKDLKAFISGGADLLNYPYLYELISILKKSNYHINIGYMSGKAIKNINMAKKLISIGVENIEFSVFSTNPEIRKEWMNDDNSEASINGLKMFCENIDLHASIVLIPGVNDGDRLIETCSNLEDWGVKSLNLIRFANFKHQGLLFSDEPLIEGINPYSYKEFLSLVQQVGDEFSFDVLGFPFYDPKNESPFAISKKENQNYLRSLNEIRSEATIITGKLAAPYLKKIFGIIDGDNLVNIINTDKEIADLIVQEDLEAIDLDELTSKVIIPSGALVHDKIAERILSKDGNQRNIIRGPYILTYPIFNDKHITAKEELINYELEAFNTLIDKINS